jgi:hypothetical protein
MRTYKIFFDTQWNRVYRNWEYGTEARNKREAREKAEAEWRLRNDSHMFHLTVEWVKNAEEIEQYKEMVGLDKFHCINWKPVTWGRG